MSVCVHVRHVGRLEGAGNQRVRLRNETYVHWGLLAGITHTTSFTCGYHKYSGVTFGIIHTYIHAVGIACYHTLDTLT